LAWSRFSQSDRIDRAYDFFDAYTAAQPAQKTLSLNSGLAAANSYYIMAQILTKRYNFTAAYNCATIAHKIQVTRVTLWNPSHRLRVNLGQRFNRGLDRGSPLLEC
jgi:hypothetical protein